MTELERVLAQLDVDWPATPSFAYRRARRRLFAVASAIVLALGIAFAVPPARSAILRFFHVGGERIEQVHSLPHAQEQALRASLGTPITPRDAEQLLTRPFAARGVRVYRSGIVVSALLSGDILFSELYTGGDVFVVKKLVAGANHVRSVALDHNTAAYWIPGRHVYMQPNIPARFAGNTLVWERHGITYRLEGRGLTLVRATALARQLR